MIEAKRLKTTRNGEKCHSLSVMIKIDETKLPDRVFIGYISYEVRPYVPQPLRCCKCQKYGHVAAICEGKQRCGRCAGEHEYGKCEVGAELKCFNCGGEHSSAYHGCEANKKATEVQGINSTQGITYADAAKQASGKEMRVCAEEKREEPCKGCDKVKEDTDCGENEFILFMVDVINCSAQTEGKQKRLKSL